MVEVDAATLEQRSDLGEGRRLAIDAVRSASGSARRSRGRMTELDVRVATRVVAVGRARHDELRIGHDAELVPAAGLRITREVQLPTLRPQSHPTTYQVDDLTEPHLDGTRPNQPLLALLLLRPLLALALLALLLTGSSLILLLLTILKLGALNLLRVVHLLPFTDDGSRVVDQLAQLALAHLGGTIAKDE